MNKDKPKPLDRKKVIAAINNIEELSDDMPNEMFEAIKNDKDAIIYALRLSVSLTKRELLEAINSGRLDEE